MNHFIPPMEYAPTADYMLDATNLTPYLVAAVLLGGALIVIVLLWMLLESRAITRADRIAAAQCRHPAGNDWGKVEPLSDGWWICVCPTCRDLGNIFPGPGQGRNLDLETVRAEYRLWNHACNV